MELTKADLNFILTRTPSDIRRQMKANERRLFLAGGFIRATLAGEKVSDIDLFGPNKEFSEGVANKIAVERKARLHKTDNAITLLSPPRVPVQFITRWAFSDAQSLVKSFDFTVCQAAIWSELVQKAEGETPEVYRWRSIISDRFYSDLAARRLFYTSPVRIEEVGGSLLRVIKFVKKGYNIQAPSLAAVVARIVSGLDHDLIRREAAIENQGQEEREAFVIAGLLRQVDPLVVIDGVDFIDEHDVV